MSHKDQIDILGFTRHNHRNCVKHALNQADSYCREHKLRFTQTRRKTLSILLENHSAMGAYDVLNRLDTEGLGSKPPVAYRALAFLVEHGFVHRIEKLNAYVACSHPGAVHEPAFLICVACGAVAETPVSSHSGKLAQSARRSGFHITNTVMEAEGQCPQCQ